MSILIKGIDLPNRCENCGFVNAYRHPPTCGLTGTKILGNANARLNNCPLDEIVHCKDCAYMDRGVKDSNEVWCCWHDSRMMEDDFCSRGKEKEHE